MRDERPGGLRRNSWLQKALVLMVAAVCVVHLVWVGRSFVRLAVYKVWEDRRLDAVSRSADVAYGYDYMRYIQFLRSEIPESGTVVLTLTAGLPQYDQRNFLQYFLIPRNVAYCPRGTVQECLAAFAAADVYFLYGPEFGVSDLVSYGLRDVPFEGGLGVLAPMSRSG